jgi:flagellar M-ring protein FliF
VIRYLEPIRSYAAALEPQRRNRLLAAAGAAVFLIVGLASWSTTVEYVPIVSGRGWDGAMNAAAALETAGVPFRLSGLDGVEVPAAAVGRARSALAASDVLPGLHDVDSLRLGLPPRAQEWALLRAAEGDLAKMIGSLDGIDGAQVHVVPRREALFPGEGQEASASVFVKLAPGGRLESEQVRSIANLVANSVEGLKPERITVADQRGTLLQDGAAAAGASSGDPDALLDYRARLEQRYERSVAQALMPVLGYQGGFSVTASVELDWTATETTRRSVDTQQQAIVSEVTEESEDERSKPAGVPGVDANLPERGGAGGEGSGASSTRAASTVSYTYPTVDEIARKPAGGIRRVSVALQLDEARLTSLLPTDGSVTREQLEQRVADAVKAAIGYDAERSDVVTVSVLPFAPDPLVDAPALPSPWIATAADFAPSGVLALGLLLAFGFVLRPIVTNALAKKAPAVDGELATAIAEGRVPEAANDDTDRLRTMIEGFEPVDQANFSELVERHSPHAAAVLRRWNTHS